VTIAAIYLRERRMGGKRRTKETRTIEGPISKGLEGLEELNRFILVIVDPHQKRVFWLADCNCCHVLQFLFVSGKNWVKSVSDPTKPANSTASLFLH
jgi:hypothetical protein